jgi:transposase InsO family protein
MIGPVRGCANTDVILAPHTSFRDGCPQIASNRTRQSTSKMRMSVEPPQPQALIADVILCTITPICVLNEPPPRVGWLIAPCIRTLLEEWAYARLYSTNDERLGALQGWVQFYNQRRPHTALGGQPPMAVLVNNVRGNYS